MRFAVSDGGVVCFSQVHIIMHALCSVRWCCCVLLPGARSREHLSVEILNVSKKFVRPKVPANMLVYFWDCLDLAPVKSARVRSLVISLYYNSCALQ